MNIVLATDNNFVQHCGVTIKSITSNNKDVNFYLLTEGLSPANTRLLESVAEENGCSLEFCIVPSDIVRFFPMSKMASSHISIATYYRLFITSLIPGDVDKVIYLDCDMVIRDSLSALWETDVTNAPLCAVYQHNEWADNNGSWERLRIPREYGYFNAGCLVMNLDYLRKNNFQHKAIEYINNHYERIISHDQDVLNAMFYKEAIPLDCKWNYLPLFWSKKFKTDEFPLKCHYKEEKCSKYFEPIIIHYVSKPKPWEYGCDNPYTSEYFKYLLMTPWKDYKVRCSLKIIYSNRVLPSIKKFLICIDFLHLRYYIRKKYKS